MRVIARPQKIMTAYAESESVTLRPLCVAIVLSLTFSHDDPCQMHGVRDLGKSHHEEGQMVHRMTTTFTPCAQLTGPSWSSGGRCFFVVELSILPLTDALP